VRFGGHAEVGVVAEACFAYQREFCLFPFLFDGVSFDGCHILLCYSRLLFFCCCIVLYCIVLYCTCVESVSHHKEVTSLISIIYVFVVYKRARQSCGSDDYYEISYKK
jgi:hypothetical protein